jgi:hypothetical protein
MLNFVNGGYIVSEAMTFQFLLSPEILGPPGSRNLAGRPSHP